MDNIKNVKDLSCGMILDDNIINYKTGVVLVGKDTAITEQLIQKIINHGIDEVKIKKNPAIQNYKLVNSYNKLERKLDSLFSDIRNIDSIIIDDVLYEMNNFAQVVSEERNILTQMRLLNQKDDYTFNHSLSVSILAISFGKWLNFSKEEIFELSLVGLFHDLGKLEIPDSIINKPAKLETEEFEIMKEHSMHSYYILLETGKFSKNVLMGVLHHHERRNGTGYPHSLVEGEIHEYAKIVSICDVYHALTSKRVYKDKKSPLKVAEYIRKESFSSLDPYLTHIFLDNISMFYVGNEVLLSNGEIGIIIYVHPQDKTKPIVKIGEDFINFLIPQEIEIVDIIL